MSIEKQARSENLQFVGEPPDHATHLIAQYKKGKLRAQTCHTGKSSVQMELRAMINADFADEMVVTNRKTSDRRTFRKGDSIEWDAIP